MSKVIDDGKICSKCQEEKPISEFSTSSTSIDGLQAYCKACVQEYNREYRQSAAGKDADQHYRQSEKGRAMQQRRWLSEAAKQAARRRRARKAGCIGSHTREEFVALCKRHDFRCLGCGEQFPLEELTEDHLIPIGPGVSDRVDNIQPLCSPCNSKKGRRTVRYLLGAV